MPERGDVLVQVRADPPHLGPADSRVCAERLDQVIDLARADAEHVGLHHDREQGLIDPATALQQGREGRPLAQFREPQLELTRRGRQRAGPGAVALGRAREVLVDSG